MPSIKDEAQTSFFKIVEISYLSFLFDECCINIDIYHARITNANLKFS